MAHHHTEQHFQSSATVRDIVIGMADGLTVPFALAAGISGAAAGMQLVVTAGIAEIAAGSIAMGLGGYLAAHSERQHYYAERDREEQEIRDVPKRERREVIDIMAQYGVTREECAPMLAGLERDPRAWRDFMMRFELGLEEPDRAAAKRSAATIAASYVAGGLIPLSPYMLLDQPRQALATSAVMTLAALWIFGYLKGRYAGTGALKSAAQALGVGGLAASAAFLVARLVT